MSQTAGRAAAPGPGSGRIRYETTLMSSSAMPRSIEPGRFPHRLARRRFEIHAVQGREAGLYGARQIARRGLPPGERGAQYASRLFFHRSVVPGRPEAQTAHRVIAQIADCDAGHLFDLTWHYIIDVIVINDISMAAIRPDGPRSRPTPCPRVLRSLYQLRVTAVLYPDGMMRT